MRIFIPRETDESRVAIVPATAVKLVKLGAEVVVEAGLGSTIHVPDADYEAAGATVTPLRSVGLSDADIVLRVRKPPADEVADLKPGCIHISHLDPFNNRDLLDRLAQARVSAISMEMIPRSTLAQKMDSLSSQANLAGYLAVIMAADFSDRIFPMMMTPSGTIPPARVFVIGAGVAGLQAIATAKRLGARVEAFDTRPAVEEQVASLGAKFVKVDLGETGQTAQGYAKALTEEQLQKQREVMTKHCAQADVVITTAQVFGRKAPLIITGDMLAKMKPGSVVVDLAIEAGGNVEGAKLGEMAVVHGVKILGAANVPGRACIPASEMLSNNFGNLVEHFWDKDTGAFRIDPTDPIQKGCLLTHGGAIVHESFKIPPP